MTAESHSMNCALAIMVVGKQGYRSALLRSAAMTGWQLAGGRTADVEDMTK